MKARHKSVQKLRLYIQSRCSVEANDVNDSIGMSELDLMKLWKGLWYCLYLADKVPVQNELSRHIAELLVCFEGTQEEDEYAAEMYLEITGGGMSDDEEEDMEDNSDADDGDKPHDEIIKKQYSSSDDENGDSTSDSDIEEVEVMGPNDGLMENNTDDEDSDDDDNQDSTQVKHCRGAHLASLFIRTFFRTMSQNWGIMDYHRMDKFYTLIRYVMENVYAYMAKRSYHMGIVRLFNDAIFEEALQQSIQIGNGLRLHLIDVVGDEFNRTYKDLPSNHCCSGEKCDSEENSEQVTKSDVFLMVFEPFLAMLQTEKDDAVFMRLVEAFENNAVLSDDVAQFFFDVASDESTLDKHRESLYNLYKSMVSKIAEEKKKKELEEAATKAKKLEEIKTKNEVVKERAKRKKKQKTLGEDSGSSVVKAIPAAETPSVSKKMKKRPKTQVENEGEITNELETPKTSKKTKTSKSPKTPTDDKKSRLQKVSTDNDDEIVISIAEQQAATKAIRAEKNSSSKKTKTSDETTTPGKSVKFKNKNESKSYNASMKGLRNAEVDYSRTPEKSILLKKLDVKSKSSEGKKSSVKKGKRKKATDWF